MKRIRYACMQQTILFQAKDDIPQEEARDLVRKEYEAYKANLERIGTKYRILSESAEPNGAIVIEIKKQLNNYPTGDYLDQAGGAE